MSIPQEVAYWIVDEVMAKGSAKDGCNESWRLKPPAFHLRKAVKHAIKAYLMYRGWMPVDAEGWKIHAKNAQTRLAMFFCTIGYVKPEVPKQG